MNDIFQQHLQYQIECGPFSVSFTVDPEGQPYEIRGIFDESVATVDDKRSTKPVPRIIVFKAPDYEAGVTKIMFRDKTYFIQKHETDANIGTVLFLR